MLKDFTVFLWLLKLGALVNLCLLAGVGSLPSGATDPHLLVVAVFAAR